jgi:actin-related protein
MSGEENLAIVVDNGSGMIMIKAGLSGDDTPRVVSVPKSKGGYDLIGFFTRWY